MYLTHYGRVGDVPRLATRMLALLDAMVAIGRARCAAQPIATRVLKRELTQLYAASLAEHGVEPTRADARPAGDGHRTQRAGHRRLAGPPGQAGKEGQHEQRHPVSASRGRVVVVTGGAQGIGEACVRRLVADGAAVALWDVDDARGRRWPRRWRADGARVAYQHCNVASKAEVDAALAATLASFGRVDGLFNNAGIFKAAPFLDITEADWDAVIDVNLKGHFLVGQAVARQMVNQGGGGAIVNMSSVNARLAIASIASYNASKGGIDQLTRVMALALADHGIRVNGVAPGTIATELAAKAVLTSEEAKARILSRTPMKRLGEPAEIASVVAFLLSDAASYMTGETVLVDGGRMTLNYTV